MLYFEKIGCYFYLKFTLFDSDFPHSAANRSNRTKWGKAHVPNGRKVQQRQQNQMGGGGGGGGRALGITEIWSPNTE